MGMTMGTLYLLAGGNSPNTRIDFWYGTTRYSCTSDSSGNYSISLPGPRQYAVTVGGVACKESPVNIPSGTLYLPVHRSA